MKKLLLLLWFFSAAYSISAQQNDSLIIRKLFTEVLTKGQCYQTLDYLSNPIGGRLSGSPEAARAVSYMQQTMKDVGLDSVWLQEVMVPHWVRGEKEEGAIVTTKDRISVNICALGNSVGTPDGGLEAQVIEVKGLEEVEKLGKEKIQGKIVFFNRPMDPIHIHTGTAYGGAVDQRSRGASMAAKYGAIGVVVRSMTLALDDNPHTGAMNYNDSFPKIPACAISTKGAEQLSKAMHLRVAGSIKFYFKQNCRMLADEKSYNVIGEIKGAEKPNEIILVGGHLDAWDNGDGAHDDGAGCVQSLEVLRLFKTLGIKPKRTLRCVLFMNEENGLRGGLKYAELAAANKEKHLAAIESDAGGFTPRGFNCSAVGDTMVRFQSWLPLLKPYGIEKITWPGGGADIGPLSKQGVITIGLVPDSQRYFDYHHTTIDTFDKVNKRELELGAASMAALVWLLSEHGVN